MAQKCSSQRFFDNQTLKVFDRVRNTGHDGPGRNAMRDLTARFIMPGDALAEPEEYIALLNAQVGQWNRTHMQNPIWGDVSFGHAVKPPLKAGAHPSGVVYAQVRASVPAGHDLYDIELARDALLDIANRFDAALKQTGCLRNIVDTIITVGFCEWRRDGSGTVGEMRTAA